MKRYTVFNKPGVTVQLREKPVKKTGAGFQGQQPQVVAVFTVLGCGYSTKHTRKQALALARKVRDLLNRT